MDTFFALLFFCSVLALIILFVIGIIFVISRKRAKKIFCSMGITAAAGFVLLVLFSLATPARTEGIPTETEQTTSIEVSTSSTTPETSSKATTKNTTHTIMTTTKKPVVKSTALATESSPSPRTAASTAAQKTIPTEIFILETAPSETPLQLISVTSPISPGSNATISIQGIPNTDYSIVVYYKSGASEADGLYPKTSDTSGSVSWSWKVGTRTTPGIWYASISGGGQTIRVDFEVS